MDKGEKRRLVELLVGSAEIFNRALSPVAIELYVKALEDLDLREVTRAFNEIARNAQFFPKPAEIRERVMGPQLTIEEEAEIEAAKVFNEVAKGSPHDDIVFDNPTTMAVIQQGMGGWLSLIGGLAKEIPFLRKQFISTYAAYKKAGIESYGKLPGVSSSMKQLRFIGDKDKAMSVLNYRAPKRLEGSGKTLEDVMELARTLGSHA